MGFLVYYVINCDVQVSRKLAFVEDELEVAEDRVKSGDAKISELEEELKVNEINLITCCKTYKSVSTKTNKC